MQPQDIANRIDTIAKALLRFVKENEIKITEINKQLKGLEEKVEDVKKDVRDFSEANKKLMKDIDNIRDAIKDGFYEIKAKIGSSLYEMKEKKEKKEGIDIISKLKESGYEKE